jgi:phage terminase large subunit-like protein
LTDLAALLDRLPPAADLARIRERLAAERRRSESTRRFELSFPDTGPLRRALYHKAVGFFAAGRDHLERGLLGGNRSGKSTTAGYELTCHLTGRYPHWWEGRRFDRPVTAWAAGDDAKSVREAAQTVLLGEPGKIGTGLIPRDAIISMTRRMGVADAYDSILVKHESGQSRLVFKAYDQRRESFQGARVDVGWCDEEPPWDVYSEFLTRLLSTVPGEPNGVMLATFTPLKGLSQVVLQFLPGGKPAPDNPRYVTFVSWDDAPHLSPELRAELEAAYMPHEREARTKGIPSIGAGAIYPVAESEIVVKPFELPPWYRRAFGMDVGWNRTAAIFGALDYETDTLFLYSEHYQSHAEPSVHAQGIRARGDWIPGAIDPAANGRSQHDGEQLLALYRDLGLIHLDLADNAVEAGIYQLWQRMSSGRLKVFDSCVNWLTEFRIYRRDDKGRIVKENDHLMDATRYLVMSGLTRAVAKPISRLRDNEWPRGVQGRSQHEYDYDPLAYGRR